MMPFSPISTLACFQCIKALSLHDLPFSHTYLADHTFFSKPIDELVKHSSVVFNRLQLNPLKSAFSLKKCIHHLEHMVSKTGLRQIWKVKAICSVPLLMDASRVTSSSGFISHYSTFIQDFHEYIYSPLRPYLLKVQAHLEGYHPRPLSKCTRYLFVPQLCRHCPASTSLSNPEMLLPERSP